MTEKRNIPVLLVKKKMSDQQIKKKQGDFFSQKTFNKIIKKSCDVYSVDETGKKKLLLVFRKNVIPLKMCCDAYTALEKEAKVKHSNRGAAAGKISKKKLPKFIGQMTKVDKYRAYYKSKDGIQRKDNISNNVSSGIIGYYDRPDRNSYRKTKGKQTKTKKKVEMCRTTKFTRDKVEQWRKTLPLIKKVDSLFKKLVPQRHKIQFTRAKKKSQFQILNTAFSTVTINYNYRTALHKDKGDLEEGFGNLIVLEKGICFSPNSKIALHQGGYLGFPQYGICVDVRQGDFLAMDVHEWHTNTPLKSSQKNNQDYGRLSLVCYLRKNMVDCH